MNYLPYRVLSSREVEIAHSKPCSINFYFLISHEGINIAETNKDRQEKETPID